MKLLLGVPAFAKNRWSAGKEVDLSMVRKSP
jgi:hypothetical protein